MALIICPECGREISDQATACPHCGFPVQSHIQTQTESYSILLDITGDEQQAEEMKSILHLTDAQIEEAVNTVLAAKPAVVATGLTKDEAEKLVSRFTHPDHFKISPARKSGNPPSSPSPMTFGSTMGAVILGVIAAVFLLSFL